MSAYSIAYIICACILLVYTLKNRLDLLCICSVCYVVYSMYCIFGIGISGFYRPKLSPMLYYCVYGQMLIILIFGMIINRINRRKRRNQKLKGYHIPEKIKREIKFADKQLDTAFYCYTAVICLFALINILSVGISGFKSGKSTVWENTNVLYVVSLYGAYPSFAYGIHNRKKWIWIPSLMVELTIFFAGARAFTATLIVIFLLERGSELWKKRKGNIKIYLLGAGAIVFLLVYRMIDQVIMQGDIGAAMRILGQADTWSVALEFNEPRVIIANYDYVLTQDFRLPWQDVLYRFLDIIPGATSIVPLKLQYSEYFSTWLQEQVHGSAGVGGTIWGESYAMFGYMGIIGATIVWLLFIKACNKHLDYSKPYSYFIVSVGTYLSWYVNRLDYNRVGQALKVTFLCFVIWAVFYLCLGGKIKVGGYAVKLKGD